MGPGSTGPRLGLRSVLFFRERGLAELADTPDLRGGRTGEVSRDALGELAEEVVGGREVVEALLMIGGADDECCRVVSSMAFTSFAFACPSSAGWPDLFAGDSIG